MIGNQRLEACICSVTKDLAGQQVTNEVTVWGARASVSLPPKTDAKGPRGELLMQGTVPKTTCSRFALVLPYRVQAAPRESLRPLTGGSPR